MARWRSEFVAPFWLATSAASCGLVDEARRQVERAVREHDPLLPWGTVVPTWDGVRELEGWEGMVREVVW